MVVSSSFKDILTFSEEDRFQMETMGISEEQVYAQIRMFQKSSFYVRIHRPCTIGDGIHQIASNELNRYVKLQEEAARNGRFHKFVPASGVATRMFKSLFQSYRHNLKVEDLQIEADRGDLEIREYLSFIREIKRFPFYNDLKTRIARDGLQMEDLMDQGRWFEILEFLITEKGVNYGALPKGLWKFHQYPSGNRTAFEEHLIEAIHTVRDREEICRLHFTVAPEYEKSFRQVLDQVRRRYEEEYRSCFEVSFSIQRHSTDTIAVDFDNRPFREGDGRLFFRPGGHGALLENLNDLRGDLIYIKNIDNVVQDRYKEPLILWKKVLGGFLVMIQDMVHQYIKQLTEGTGYYGVPEKIMMFAQDKLSILKPRDFNQWTSEEKKGFLLNKLNRPIRVCGMVQNRGEPGGGPFWVREKDGTLSVQIIENAQIDSASSEQQAIWTSSTHFNPVDLICAVRDYQGRPFHLHRYANPETVFISEKSKDGKKIKSLELPGLWNGSMYDWITLFVEVPEITFNPVKTVNDLLRPQHQPG